MNSATFWDKAAAKYAKDPITDMAGYVQTRDRIRDVLQPHHRVLELGCGTGSTAFELADRVDRYIGTDVSPQMIAIAQGKQVDGQLGHLSFAVGDAAHLPGGPHDVILALNLLHLLPGLENVLAQIFNSLPSGGMLIAKTSLLKDGAWFVRWAIPVMRAVGKAPFVRILGEAELRKLFQAAGFVMTETLIQDGMVPRMFTVVSKP